MRHGAAISQEELRQLFELEKLLTRWLKDLRTRATRGSGEEPGPLALNHSALFFPLPRLIFNAYEDTQPDFLPCPEGIYGSHFLSLRDLLDDAEISALNEQGFRQLATRKRKLNRKLYRELLAYYVQATRVVFTSEFSSLFQENAGFGQAFREMTAIRFWFLVLKTAPLAHRLRLSHPEKWVEKALRRIDRLMTPLSIIFDTKCS